MNAKTPIPHAARTWYRLDNAAKIYPVIMRSRHGSVYRLTADLKETIDPEVLQQAVALVMPRFPFFAVKLSRGLFWFYLQSIPGCPKVEPDVQNPMRQWRRKDVKSFLFRVRYYERRIAIEVFHSLTDGSGGLVYLKTLIATYLRLVGKGDFLGEGVLDINEPAQEAEMADDFKRFSDFRSIRRPKESAAFHLQGNISAAHNPILITGTMPLDKTIEVAKQHNTSLTEFLAGIYIYELYQIQQQGGYRINDPIRLSIPINVRRYYPSKTLRNFSLFVNPTIEPALGIYTLEEILGLVHHYMRFTVNEKFLNGLMCANVSPERSMALRLAPLPIKTAAMRLAYHLVGESRFTSALSNLGAINLPEGMAEHVERFDFVLGPSHFNAVNCSMLSYGNQLIMTFTGTMPETDLQRAFFKQLVRFGIPVRVESNNINQEEV